jgi:hypothetical protein
LKQNEGRTTIKELIFSVCLATFLCVPISAFAQDTTPDTSVNYSFRTINFPNDTFTQLLGINNHFVIAGYHGSGATGHPNQGFTLALTNPITFTPENFPGSVQTQVIGINNSDNTAGFYIDKTGANHGFLKFGTFTTVDFPGTTSVPAVNQLLSFNDNSQLAGFYNDAAGNSHGYIYARSGGVFEVFTIPTATSAQATGINDQGNVCGFFVKGGVTKGFLLIGGFFMPLNFPGATATTFFGLNNVGQAVGTYTDTANAVHGFVYNIKAGSFQKVDDPSGVGATIINGINDKGYIVGFFGSCTTGGATCDGFLGTPTP